MQILRHVPVHRYRAVLGSSLVLAVGAISGCVWPTTSVTQDVDPGSDQPMQVAAAQLRFPEQWERIEKHTADTGFDGTWLTEFNDSELDDLIEHALTHNHALQAQAAQVEELRQGVIIARANRLPSLSGDVSVARRKTRSPAGDTTDTVYSLGVDSQFEVDVWGRLSDDQRRAQLQYRAAQYQYEDARVNLIADVARSWYGAVYAHQLLGLFQQRVTNIRQNLEIIESGYQQGINSALDVYLARTSAEQEHARLAQQQQIRLEQVGQLQTLLADYPSGQLTINQPLPRIDASVLAGLPSQLVSRRPDVQQAWSQLLAQYASVAIAHKQRFPSLLLSASLGDSATSFSDVVDGSDLLWSTLGAIGQSLFQGGQLRALEQRERARLEQSEQAYLVQLQQAFLEVENALSEYRTLGSRLNALTRAEKHANAAYELSFQQYQRGLVNYTTVLQAEQRAFDANFNLIDLRFRILVNRIDLYTALGGGEVS